MNLANMNPADSLEKSCEGLTADAKTTKQLYRRVHKISRRGSDAMILFSPFQLRTSTTHLFVSLLLSMLPPESLVPTPI
jgi:hypothetical protein